MPGAGGGSGGIAQRANMKRRLHRTRTATPRRELSLSCNCFFLYLFPKKRKMNVILVALRILRTKVTANTFEADNVAHELPAQAQRMAALLEAWVATLDPIKPGTMGASATHAGCAAYAFPSGGPDGAAAVSAAQLLADAEHDPYLV